jgi:hypothetical protein
VPSVSTAREPARGARIAHSGRRRPLERPPPPQPGLCRWYLVTETRALSLLYTGRNQADRNAVPGYRFRSRLEARWAVFFDVAGIPWQYEPEGFDLSSVQAPTEVKLLWASELMYERLGRSVRTGDVNEDDEDSPMWYLHKTSTFPNRTIGQSSSRPKLPCGSGGLWST